jgi:lipopolysaccharide/colanic/teichoic acid biosynthesis glycosyltransferase
MECLIDKVGTKDDADVVPGRHPVWKRTLDIGCIALSAPVVLPLMILIAVLIRLVSPGPVLFRQQRVGYRGHPFTIFKFRSMHVATSVETHKEHLKQLMSSGVPMTKMDNIGDPRVIPMGRLLRSTGLDELPQLINVLRGEMSLVGPRPCIPYEYESYLSHQRKRCLVVPGLTGLWQVSGKNKTTFDEMIRLDVLYCQKRSLILDCFIIFKTIPALVIQVIESRYRKKRVDVHVNIGKPSEFNSLSEVAAPKH